MQVSSGNLPIPNDTGANVLADMNENILALQSNNAGNSAPSVAKAHQTWIDTSGSVDVLKIKGDTDNAAFITLGNLETNLGMMPKTGGSFTGNVQTTAGTKASPSIQINDANTGLYKPGSGTIGLSCGGTDIAYVETTGIEIKDGKKLEFRDSGNSNVVSLQAPALTSDVALTLPSDDGNADEVLTTNGSGVLSFQAVQGVPTGTIFPFAGAETDIPGGYLECDGSQKSSTTYSELSTLLGNTYNNGQTPSSGNFFLPDLRGQFIRGWDHGANVDSGRTRGSTQNDANKAHNHAASSNASVSESGHFHHSFRSGNAGQLQHNSNLNSGNFPASGTGAGNLNECYNITASGSTPNVGRTSSKTTGVSVNVSTNTSNDGTTESRPKNIAMIYIIKT